MKWRILLSFCLALVAANVPQTGYTEDFYCEVMAVQGTALLSNQLITGKVLQESQILKSGDTITTSSDSYVDIAYDREWLNVARIGANSQVEIRSVYPMGLKLAKGDIFAKLDGLPKDATFEIQTPVAVAAVRGSLYRATHTDLTHVYNYSRKSDVFVFGLNPQGNIFQKYTGLVGGLKTEVAQRGQPPSRPKHLTRPELRHGNRLRLSIQDNINAIVKRGRVGKAPLMQWTDEHYRELIKNRKVPAYVGRGGIDHYENRNLDRKGERERRRPRPRVTGGGGGITGGGGEEGGGNEE